MFICMHAWIQQTNEYGVFGVRTELLYPSIVHGDEGSCLPHRLDSTHLYPNNILFLLSRRDGSCWQVGKHILLSPSQFINHSKNLRKLKHLKFDQHYKKNRQIYDIK